MSQRSIPSAEQVRELIAFNKQVEEKKLREPVREYFDQLRDEIAAGIQTHMVDGNADGNINSFTLVSELKAPNSERVFTGPEWKAMYNDMVRIGYIVDHLSCNPVTIRISIQSCFDRSLVSIFNVLLEFGVPIIALFAIFFAVTFLLGKFIGSIPHYIIEIDQLLRAAGDFSRSLFTRVQ